MKSIRLAVMSGTIAMTAAGFGMGSARKSQSPSDPYVLYENPGKMVRVHAGNRLSMYCVGAGAPTVVLETGFGGGAYLSWREIQPLLGKITRTCSYDRAGYGFSELGDDLPRDLDHCVADLHDMLVESREPGPYILVGHSNGGKIIGAYADRYPKEVAGLVFLDAAVSLNDDLKDSSAEAAPPADQQAILDKHLASIRRCLARMESAQVPAVPKQNDECIDAADFADLPSAMTKAILASMSSPTYWRAYLSEAECNYGSVNSRQARALLPHAWKDISVRVVIASIASMSDVDLAKAYGISPTDQKAIATARANRTRWEDRQARICESARDCRIDRIPTAKHDVQNAFPRRVAGILAQLVQRARSEHRDQQNAGFSNRSVNQE